MVLIYAGIAPRKPVDGAEATEAEELRIRAKLLLHQLSDATIVFPAIAASETAVPIKPELRGPFVGKLSELFLCHPFDLQAAAIAADLWKFHKRLPKDERYKDRHLLKADTMVVATARAAGATEFYSHDTNCRKLASNVMNSYDLPTDDPNDMFARSDIQRGEL